MILQRTRRATAILALVAVLALAAPAHATGWRGLASGPAWLEQALSWITHLWMNDGEPAPATPTEKCCSGPGDPDTGPPSAPPPSQGPIVLNGDTPGDPDPGPPKG